MNSYKRITNTINGLPVDRTPAYAITCSYGGVLTGTDLTTIYTDPNAYVAGQQAVIDRFGFDMIPAPYDVSAIAEAFEGQAIFFKDQQPNMRRPAAADADSALKLPIPDPRKTGRLPYLLSTVRQLVDIYGKDIPVFAAIPGPCILPTLMMGLEGWMQTFLFDEELSEKILARSGIFFNDLADALFDSGITTLVAVEGFATEEILPRVIFEERCLPHIRSLFSKINGPVIFHHSGGKIGHMLDLIPGIPNVAGVIISSQDDLIESRKKIGSELTLIGNLDNLSFRTDSPETIYHKSMTALKEMAPYGRFILSNSAAEIPVTTPPENLNAMIEACTDFAEGKTV